MTACYTRRRPTICAVQGRQLHAKLDVVLIFVLSKFYDGRLCPTSSDCVQSKDDIDMLNLMLSDYVCFS